MEMIAPFAEFGNLSSTACYINAIVMTMMSAWLALNLEPPKKQDR
jgi:hypothetical protein